MKARTYAEALYRAAEEAPAAEHERLAYRMVELVREHGHARLLPEILRELTHLTHLRTRRHTVTVRVASHSDEARYEPRIAADTATLECAHLPRTVIEDEGVIGGYEVRCGSRCIDRTHKRTLRALYRTLTNSA